MFIYYSIVSLNKTYTFRYLGKKRAPDIQITAVKQVRMWGLGYVIVKELTDAGFGGAIEGRRNSRASFRAP